ncbi:Pentatricopeptide repeat-containing protein [Apostasia shenzhenica]|uniref:Pentatricopeptide repeat-containing protein n=1 Tax=Apostasia shenzhenica TaxID=1088818 RepID=A0A2I0AL31_9ASPA|nr:Pentatricopeptide repeat-containing protein [Apostasia shenzhenica]
MLGRLCRLRSLAFKHLQLTSYSKSCAKTMVKFPGKRIPRSKGFADPSHTIGSRRRLAAVHPLPRMPSDSTASLILTLLSESRDGIGNLGDLLKGFKSKLTSDLVLQILTNCKQLGRPKTLEFFSWAGFQLEFRFDDAVVEYMADFLGRRRLFDDLKCLLKTVASQRGRVSSRAVSISIRFLGKEGRIAEALSLFERIEMDLNCSPDILVFNNVLYVLCRKDPSGNSIDVALLIFGRIGKPDVFSYSNIIIGLCRFGRWKDAVEIFYKMHRACLVPTRTAANVLIRQLYGFKGKELVEKVMVTSVRRPFEILVPIVRAKSCIETAVIVFWIIFELGLIPNGHVINGLISELCMLQRFEKVIEILKMVRSRKLRCAEESYAIVIEELCEVYKINEACFLFDDMLSQGLRPKLALYNSLIRMLCKLKYVEEAKKYFSIMCKRRCEPDCATYSMLIHAYIAAENLEDAYPLLIEMIEMGWHPHFEIYSLVNNLIVKNGRPDLSVKLERKMAIQHLYTHCKAGRVDAAYEHLKSLITKRFFLPIFVRDAFEHAFRRAGKWKVACEILRKMDKIMVQQNEKFDKAEALKLSNCAVC